MKQISFALGLLILLTGCNSTFREHDPLPTVNRVDLDQFMGKWYVLATTPGFIDREPFNAVETFSRADRGIEITYAYNEGSSDGEVRTMTSRAMIDNPGINTDWDISYTWPFGSDAKVIYLEPDYSVAVMGHPNRRHVTLLSRQKRIADPLYSDIILNLQQMGYDVGKIRRIPHR
jgi:apolipoprotein D and lipocalin family protein